ncbi:MAG: glycosyltransferase family 2 protein [Candidatus Saccharimonadales bacterium]
MQKALTLSLVIPVYNEQDHLKSCLEAVAKQTVIPDEVIVVDNNSTDKSVKIAESFPFVKIVNEVEQGVTFARNKGFNIAKSAIIGRIDSDTRLEPDWVEKVLEIFSKEPDLAAITGSVAYYDMPLVSFGKKIDSSVRTLVSSIQTVEFLYGSNMAITKDSWIDVRDRTCILDSIHEDLDLAIHLNKAGHKIAYKSQLLAATSSRRFDDDPVRFHKYMKMNIKTYRVHGIETVTPRMSTSIYWLAYITLKPLRYTYDHETRKLSLKNMTNKRKARVNPGTGRH